MSAEIARGRSLGKFDKQFVRVGRSAFVLREWLSDGTAVGRRWAGSKAYRIEQVPGDAGRWRIVDRLEIRPDGATWKVVAREGHDRECDCDRCSVASREAFEDRCDAEAREVAFGAPR